MRTGKSVLLAVTVAVVIGAVPGRWGGEALAQHLISTKAGFVNRTEGRVEIERYGSVDEDRGRASTGTQMRKGDRLSTLADGLAVPEVGDRAFAIARDKVDRVVSVDEEEISWISACSVCSLTSTSTRMQVSAAARSTAAEFHPPTRTSASRLSGAGATEPASRAFNPRLPEAVACTVTAIGWVVRLIGRLKWRG